jgi:hypothetical protein
MMFRVLCTSGAKGTCVDLVISYYVIDVAIDRRSIF